MTAMPPMRHLLSISELDQARLDALLRGKAGRFTILSGTELTVGRDGSRATAVLAHPKVSGLHATFRMEGGVLSVRDEGSNAGTRVRGERLAPGQFVELTNDDSVDLGPEVLKVELIRS